MSKGGDVRGQRARARERGTAQEQRTGLSALQGGSSGLSLYMSRMLKREFADIENDAELITGMPFVIHDIRKTINGTLIITAHVSASYQVEAMQMMDACRYGYTWAQLYLVPRRPFMPPEDLPTADEGQTT